MSSIQSKIASLEEPADDGEVASDHGESSAVKTFEDRIFWLSRLPHNHRIKANFEPRHSALVNHNCH